MSEVTASLKAGALHQGVLRVGRFARDEAWVASAAVGRDILVRGRPALNRAFDGDVVAVELLPEREWGAPSARLPSGQGGGGAAPSADGDADDAAADADDDAGAAVAQVDPGEHYGGDAGLAAADGEGGKPAPPPCGRVVAIIRRSWRARSYAGTLLPPARAPPPPPGTPSSALFAPSDRKLPLVRIVTRQLATLLGRRVVVAVDAWPPDADAPTGHYVRTLGPAGDKAAETEALLLEHDVPDAPFTPDVLACVPPLPWCVSDADRADPRREDWTAVPCLSVDPPGCTDIDDALHVRPLAGGVDADGYEFEIGVHIADVGHFLHPATPADAEAARRGTSVYLVGRRIDMLPKALTEDICSLRAGVDRLAFSVVWRATADGVVSPPRFFKSVIRSVASLTYAEAQARIDDPAATDGVSGALKTLARMTAGMRARRAAAGALTLASPEVRFELDTETHDPLDVGMYVVRAANSMVEEMMLLANVAAARATLAAFPGAALLRRHPAPPPAHFAPLLAAAASAGFTLDVSSSRALADSLDAAVRADDPFFNRLLRILATRCMTPAAYAAAGGVPHPPDRAHYGLACPLYTHFTSPIRRYADVIVHRLLAAAVGAAPPPRAPPTRAATRTRRLPTSSTCGTGGPSWRRGPASSCTRCCFSGGGRRWPTRASCACAPTACSSLCPSTALRDPPSTRTRRRGAGPGWRGTEHPSRRATGACRPTRARPRRRGATPTPPPSCACSTRWRCGSAWTRGGGRGGRGWC
jgi:exosome complex exonuclease DIS3/RRP44